MSIPLDAPITGAPAKPVPFSAARPGGTIRITGKGYYAPVDALVLRSLPEYGPRGLPALFVNLVDTDEERLVLQDGIQIEILSDPSKLFGNFVPASAVQARRRPTEIAAVQFRGDAVVAVDILKWCAGKVNVRHIEGTLDRPAHLIFTYGGESEVEAQPGDWVYLEHGEVKVMKPEDFQREFAVLTPAEVAAR
jgi:hypothetical protein